MADRKSAGRGDTWVVAQFALMGTTVVLAVLGPDWPAAVDSLLDVVGAAVVVGGVAVGVLAARSLGRSMTPFPRPRDNGELVTGGPFSFVRHPVYTGFLAGFLGLCLICGPLGLPPWLALVALWIGKLRVEERHLRERFPQYEAYAERVRWRLLPGVY